MIKRNEGYVVSLKMIKFNNSKKKLKTAEKYIPLGSQTFSKSRLVLPEKISPFFIKKSKDSFFGMWIIIYTLIYQMV